MYALIIQVSGLDHELHEFIYICYVSPESIQSGLDVIPFYN